MRIGIFSDTYFPQINGVGTSIRTLAQGLEAQGHRVYIFTPWDPNSSEDESEYIFRVPSMPFLFAKNFRTALLCPPHLLRKIKDLQLDIIHTQTEFSLGFLGKFVATTQGIPLVHTYHTMYEDYVHYIGGGYLFTQEMSRDYSKLFCNATTAIITPTQKTEDLLLSYGVDKPISIIPTGINTKRFQRENYAPEEILALRQSYGLEADTPVVLSLGRVAKEKSIDVVMESMPKLLEQLPTAKMVVVGDGPERENLEALANTLGIAEHVIFTGAKPWDEIGKYYQLGDVFCSASTSETQGLTFAEAMAAGVPVVAQKDPCIETIIQHEETGLLFEDEMELSSMLYSLLSDAKKQSDFSKRGMEAMKNLSAEAFCSNVAEVYTHVLENTEDVVHIVAPALPLVMGAKAAIRITKLPKKIVVRSYHRTKKMAEHFPYFRKKDASDS
ncbi:glycosyltransferase family 4 protein [Chakrabartyella piscis]|uniref:glycosyltransferase family 4 protein n=1 Tax=Chakrabartyella piscis TaxID=2918914 RepID=UPI002958B6C6|nr:glycosyltransferase family 4 protein [Chakrabartyella piscis]